MLERIDIHGHIINKVLMPDNLFLEKLGHSGIDMKIVRKIGDFLSDGDMEKVDVLEWIIDHVYEDVELNTIIKLYLSGIPYYLRKTLEKMDKAGIEKMVMLGLDLHRWDNKPEDDYFQECFFYNMLDELTNQRLIGFVGIDLDRLLQLRSVDERMMYHILSRAKGFKLYPKIGYDVGSELYDFFFDYAEKALKPIVTHCSGGGVGVYDEYGSPKAWNRVLIRHPLLYVDLGHAGGEFSKWTKEIVPLVMEYENLYVDVAFHSGAVKDTKQYFFELMELIDDIPGNVLFGSDFPLHTVMYKYDSLVRSYRENLHKFYWDLISYYNPTEFLFNR